MNYPSNLLENAVNELSRLPGIGRKTALRLALFLLNRDTHDVERFGEAIIKMRQEVRYCKVCHNISDEETCNICSSPKRNKRLICIVQDIRDIMALENTGQFSGVYYVLGGVISPVDGIGPDDLNIAGLAERITENDAEEIVFALPTTIEGDTTNYYLYKLLKQTGIVFTTLARGISIGDDIEYIDELTLGRSISNRLPYSED